VIPYEWKGSGYATERFKKCCKSIGPDMALVMLGYQSVLEHCNEKEDVSLPPSETTNINLGGGGREFHPPRDLVEPNTRSFNVLAKKPVG